MDDAVTTRQENLTLPGAARKAIEGLSRLTGRVGEGVLVFMAVSILYDVFMRYVFAAPTNWALEINTFLLVLICVVPSADALQSDGHIRITFLTESASPVWTRILTAIRAVAGLALSAALVWSGSAMAWSAWQYDDRVSSSLATPLFIPYLFIPVGFFILGLCYLQMLMGTFTAPAEDQSPGSAD